MLDQILGNSILDTLSLIFIMSLLLLTFVAPAKLLLPEIPIGISSIIYFGAIAGIVSISASFYASIANSVIYMSIFLNIGITLYFFLTNVGFRLFTPIMRCAKQFLVFCLILVILLYPYFIRFNVAHISDIAINSHEIYFSNVTIELLDSEYSSRLRIRDSYPSEWSSYGFFSGGAIAIPLVLFSKVGVVEFLLAKILLVSFLVSIIANLISFKWKWAERIWGSALTISFIGLFVGHLQWSLITQHVFTLLFILVILIRLNVASFGESILLALILAATHPRAIFLGFGIILYHFVQTFNTNWRNWAQVLNGKSGNRVNLILLIYIYSLTIVSSFFSGLPSEDQPAIAIDWIEDLLSSRGALDLAENFISIWFSPSWQQDFAIGTHLISFLPSFVPSSDLKYSLPAILIFHLIVLCVCIFKARLAPRKSSEARSLFLSGCFLFFTLFFIIISYFLTTSSQSLNYLILFCVFTVLPIITLHIAMDWEHKKFRNYLLFFTLAPALFVNSGIWGPMFMSLELISFFYLSRYLLLRRVFLGRTFALAVLALSACSVVLLALNWVKLLEPSSHDPYTHRINLINLPQRVNISCPDLDDTQRMALSFLGVRAAYDPKRTETFVVSRRFVVNKQTTLRESNTLCARFD